MPCSNKFTIHGRPSWRLKPVIISSRHRNAGRVLIRNFEGKVFEYPETADGKPCSQPKGKISEPELV